MSAEDFESLRDSIANIGVQNPITLLDGMVLDGWHRYQAANDLAMTCPSAELGDWIDPRDFVLAQNKMRRHITQAQLIAAASAVFEWREVGRPGNTALSAELKVTSKDVAEKTGASIRSVEQYRAAEKTATPEVMQAVKRGDIGLPKAAAIAKMPKAEQAAAIDKPLPKKVSQVAPPAPVEPEPQSEAPPEYTEMDALRDQISELQADLVVARMGDVSDEEKQQAAAFIAELQSEIKTLLATVQAANLSRDFLMEENAQMKKQMQMQRREIEKLKAGK